MQEEQKNTDQAKENADVSNVGMNIVMQRNRHFYSFRLRTDNFPTLQYSIGYHLHQHSMRVLRIV